MYNIAVRIDGILKRRRSAGLLHIVLGLFLIIKAASYYRYTGYKNFLPLVPVLLIGSFSIFYGSFRKRIDPFYKSNYWLRLLQVISFTFLGVLMINAGKAIDYIGVFVFAFLSIILLFSERKIFHDTTIYILEEGIKIPGYYRDHLVKWECLSNVVIREDFITLFHIKEKFLQFQVEQDLSALELAKMNAFCKEKTEGKVAEAEG